MTRHETFIYLFESTGWSGVRWEKLTGIPRQTLSVWKNNDSSSIRPYVLIAMAAVSGKQIKWLNEEMTSCEVITSHFDRCFHLMTDKELINFSYNEVKTFLKEIKTDE